LEASDFNSMKKPPSSIDISTNSTNTTAAAPPSTPGKGYESDDNDGVRLSDLDKHNSSSSSMGNAHPSPAKFGKFKSSSFVQPSHAMTSSSSSSNNEKLSSTKDTPKSSSKKIPPHSPSGGSGGGGGSSSGAVIVAGIPPSPSIHDLSYLMKPDKPLAPLIRDIEYAMWNPKPPAFVGRPPEITHADMLYESCVPVNYDSDLENSNNFAWCPEDDFIECKV